MMVEMSARAEADLLEIVDYLSQFSSLAAERFISAFERALLQLRDFPESGLSARSGPSPRALHVGVYEFQYVLKADRVVIRRIKDGRRRA